MYGFINLVLEELIIKRFGEEIWEEIHAKASAAVGEKLSFMTNIVSDDNNTFVVLTSAVEILGIDPDNILEMFGEQFLLWCRESGYAQTLHLLGHNLIDFLSNIDALHDHLSVIYPNMRAPSFRCTEDEDGVITLHYYSERHGLESLVPGMVKCFSRELFGIEIMVECLDKVFETNGLAHVTFKITQMRDDTSDMAEKWHIARTPSISSTLPMSGVQAPTISQSLFCKAFPFHIIFDRDMRIRQLGTRLKKLINQLPGEEILISSIFSLQHPRVDFTFQNVLNHVNTVYILSAAIDHPALGKMHAEDNTFMRLRGQMLYMEESNCMLYVCSPYVRRLEDLSDRGLRISDIPIHDASRGLIIAEGALESEFQYVVEMERLLIEKKELALKLQKRKERMRNLLHEIMPSSVATTLLRGSTVEARSFECVTILFSDIVGFTRICQRCTPDVVVNMLNDLYCYFDQVVSRNNVYKVETIGDAYMVVGGLPEPNKTHAADVCNQAIDMMMCAQKVTDPTNPDKSITIRIGIHSGEVAAGVVGIRMPRYCLFGDTVNVASRTESNSVPGRINITEWTYARLCNEPNWVFEMRGPIHFKNVDKPVVCYWLIENTNRLQQPKPSLQCPAEVPVFAEFVPPSASTSRHASQIWDSFPSFPLPNASSTEDPSSETPPYTESVTHRLNLMGPPEYHSQPPSVMSPCSSTGVDDEPYFPFFTGVPQRARVGSDISMLQRLKIPMTKRSQSVQYPSRRPHSPLIKQHPRIIIDDESEIPSRQPRDRDDFIAQVSRRLEAYSDNTAYSESTSDVKTSSLSPEPVRKVSNISEHSGIDSGCDPLDSTELEIEGTSETHQPGRTTGIADTDCTGLGTENYVQQKIKLFEKLSDQAPRPTETTRHNKS